MKVLYGTFATILSVLLVYYWDCHILWERRSDYLYRQLESARPGVLHHSLDLSTLDSVPDNVRHYILQTISDRKIKSLQVKQQGVFKLKDSWHKFYATQFITTEPIGFLWDATIYQSFGNSYSFAELPAHLHIPVYVRDSYVNSVGGLEARVYQTVPIMNLTRSSELDQGELLRWVAETPLVPTALFPSDKLSWEFSSHNRSLLYYKEHKLDVGFREGLIHTVSGMRPKLVDNVFVETKFQGRCSEYTKHQGMLVPEYMEIGWFDNETNTYDLYFKATLSDFEYDFY